MSTTETTIKHARDDAMSVEVFRGRAYYDPGRGHVVRLPELAWIVRCPACQYVAHRDTRGDAERTRASHTKGAHGLLLEAGAMTIHFSRETEL